jgi:CysZ protein
MRNLFWQSVYLLAIMILSLVPLAGWIGPPLTLFIECYYLGSSMLDYSAERNRLTMQESISFTNRHKGLAIGNGMVFYLMHLVPLVGWILAPSYAVVAATISYSHARNENIFS